VHDF